jgi:hypothetical protein
MPTPECISSQQLAARKGWTDIGCIDKKYCAQYCALRVNLSTPDELPFLWLAIGDKPKQIYQDDQNRFMSSGVWIIYPPFACREMLGCPLH